MLHEPRPGLARRFPILHELIDSLEGAREIGTGNLTSRSEQQFVVCFKANSSCNDGLVDSAFQYAEGVAVTTESSCPYNARDGSCMI